MCVGCSDGDRIRGLPGRILINCYIEGGTGSRLE